MYATNCWVIATEPGAECIIVDPGMPDVSHQLTEILEKHNLKPVAVIATHGHLDHTFSIQPIADGYGIATYIHSEDRAFLAQPEKLISPEFAATISQMSFLEPQEVREVRNGDQIELVGLSFKAIHAPGHTRGSLMFEVSNEVLISGDVLFAGSIGRTDLPTGSAKEMEETLRKKVLTLDDHLRVLTGHGVETTIGSEKASNPYLKNLVGRY
jgi:glyoxylase-like metal-dependent hydrolase (beta-lactamase superfamily II)